MAVIESAKSVPLANLQLENAVRCPRCAAPLNLLAQHVNCPGCGHSYPRFGEIPILLPEPHGYLEMCRRQLALLEQQIRASERAIEEQLGGPDLLPLTKTRCRAVVNSARGQLADISAILQPLLGDAPASDRDARLARPKDDLPSLLTNVHYIFRDWGWPPEEGGENERALASVEGALEGQSPGLMLVLGAGACRLAYDLHCRTDHPETAVVDIDPLLLAVAHRVIRGGTLRVRESYAEVNEIGNAERRWELSARRGPAGKERFHFVLANGLEPPFSPAVFDTVITPWFIDVVPGDVREVISTVHRLLKPGGRWVNVGPLRYTPDVPVTRRYTREEIFDLAERAGFRIGRWVAESGPSLVSKHTGRGKVECVMTFAALKLDTDAMTDAADGPPDWLLFRHRPIPVFPGQSLLYSRDPLAQIVTAAIDGRRSLDDVTRIVASRMDASNLSIAQIHEAVRRCLAEVHPACRD